MVLPIVIFENITENKSKKMYFFMFDKNFAVILYTLENPKRMLFKIILQYLQ